VVYPAHPMFLSSHPPFADPNSDISGSEYDSDAALVIKPRKRSAGYIVPPSSQPFYPQYMCASSKHSFCSCILTSVCSPMHMPLSLGSREDASHSHLFQDDSARFNAIPSIMLPEEFDPMSMLNADMFSDKHFDSFFTPIPAVQLIDSSIPRLGPFPSSNSNIGSSKMDTSR
jgi:hypothetical protein